MKKFTEFCPLTFHFGIFLCLCLPLFPAYGQSQPITQSDYEIDLYQGTIMGSPRVIGLGGAYTGLGEGVVATPFNPAASAHRTDYSSTYFDWDFGFDVILPPTMQSENFDMDNNGQSSSQQYMALSGGLQLQFGQLGVGIYVMGRTYKLEPLAGDSHHLKQAVCNPNMFICNQIIFSLARSFFCKFFGI